MLKRDSSDPFDTAHTQRDSNARFCTPTPFPTLPWIKGAFANLLALPLAHSQDEGILTECRFHFARIDSVSQQVASVLVTRLGALKTDLGVCSQIPLLTLPREVEFAVPAPSAFRCHEKIQVPANSDLSRVAHGLDIANVVFGSEANR
jgi:hypothetical protein